MRLAMGMGTRFLIPAFAVLAAVLGGGQTRHYPCYGFDDDPDNLIADCSNFILAHPDNDAMPFWFSRRGYGFYRKGEYDRAIADYDKAMEWGSGGGEGYELRAIAYDAKGDYDQAVQDAQEAVMLGSWNDGARYNLLGIVYRHKGDYQHAIMAFNDALHLFSTGVDNPGRAIHARWLNNRAMAKLGLGDVNGANADFAEARMIDPDTRCTLSPNIVDTHDCNWK